MNWFQRIARRALGIPVDAPAASVPAGTPPLTRLNAAAMRAKEQPMAPIDGARYIRAMYPGAKELGMPDLPRGVVPERDPENIVFAMDSGVQEIARDSMPSTESLFSWGNTSMAFGYFFQGYPYLAQLTQISEYRAPSDVLADEMTRKWIKLKATDKKKVDDGDTAGDGSAEDGAKDLADKITEIEQCMEDMKVREHFRTCIKQDGYFGRSQMYIRIKGQEGDDTRQLPLEIGPESIKAGQLLGFQPIEAYWTTPYSYNATDPTRPDFYKPQSWFVMGKKTHHSRLLLFIGRPVPDLLKPSYNFGGLSWTQLLEPAVNMWLRTRKSVNDLIHNFSITALMTNLNALLADTENGGLMGRAQLITNMRDNQGLMLLNKSTEELAQVNTPLSGLDKLQAQSQEHMAAICHQPLVIMTGVEPAGLNASSEGSITVWHEFVGSQQKNMCDAPLKLIIEAVQCHLYGSIDDGITHEWVPLNEPTAEQLAAERKSDADRDGTYVDKGVLDPQEVRDRLAKDPTSGYDGLTGDAPGPPLDPNADPGDGSGDDEDADAAAGEAEAGREHTSSEADADRQHESAENDKDRAHELKLAVKKKLASDAAFTESQHPRDKGGRFDSDVTMSEGLADLVDLESSNPALPRTEKQALEAIVTFGRKNMKATGPNRDRRYSAKLVNEASGILRKQYGA